MEIYGFDLKKEAQLDEEPGKLSAAAQRALDRYSTIPEKMGSWKVQTKYRQHEKSKEQKQREYFDIKAKEMTTSLEQELKAVQLRNVGRAAYNPDELDTHVQFGIVKEGPAQFYSSRLTKKERKANLVDQLLDPEDKKVADKLRDLKELEKEKRIAKYKTQVKLNRKSKTKQRQQSGFKK